MKLLIITFIIINMIIIFCRILKKAKYIKKDNKFNDFYAGEYCKYYSKFKNENLSKKRKIMLIRNLRVNELEYSYEINSSMEDDTDLLDYLINIGMPLIAIILSVGLSGIGAMTAENEEAYSNIMDTVSVVIAVIGMFGFHCFIYRAKMREIYSKENKENRNELRKIRIKINVLENLLLEEDDIIL